MTFIEWLWGRIVVTAKDAIEEPIGLMRNVFLFMIVSSAVSAGLTYFTLALSIIVAGGASLLVAAVWMMCRRIRAHYESDLAAVGDVLWSELKRRVLGQPAGRIALWDEPEDLL